jgi:hypothetical protein
MPITGSDTALMYAVAGLARSGATRSDYFRPIVKVTIAGVDRTGACLKRSLTITELLDEAPNTATLRVRTDGSYESVVLDDEPFGYWRLGENANDSVGTGHGVVNGSVQFGVTGVTADNDGGALFDHSTTHIDLGNLPDATTALTMEMWIKGDGDAWSGAGVGIEIPFSYGSTGHYLGINDNGSVRVSMRISGTQRTLASLGVTLDPNTWYHIVGTWTSGDRQRLYINGQLNNQSGTTFTGTLDAANVAQIGRFTVAQAYFGGTIDECAVYDHALTADEIAEHYRARLLTAFMPAKGQEVIIGLGAISNRIFAGYILNTNLVINRKTSRFPRMELDLIDYTWLLDHFVVYGKKWDNVSASTVIQQVFDAFVPAALGFSTVRVQAGLPTISIQSNDDETIPQFLSRLMKLIGGYWYVDYSKIIHAYTGTETDANPVVLDDNNTTYWDLRYSDDLSQARTRVRVHGGSTTTTAAAAAGATTLAVDDTRLFSSSGGKALVGANQITYTGKSVGEGPGDLTGVSGLVYDIAQGDSTRVLAIEDDLTGQAAIAALLGGGHTGVITHTARDGNAGEDAAHAVGTAQLAIFPAAGEQQLAFKTKDKAAKAGKAFTANITTPATVSGTFLIQRVTLSNFEIGVARFPTREVECGVSKRDIEDLLKHLG